VKNLLSADRDYRLWVLLQLFFLMIRRPPRSTQSRSSAASDVYKRQFITLTEKGHQAYSRTIKNEAMRDIASCLTEEERQQLELSLREIQERALKNLASARTVPFP